MVSLRKSERMRIGVVDSAIEYVTSNLKLDLDAAQLRSYAGTGTTWTDISGNSNNGTLTNGPTFNSGNGGYFILDGVDDTVLLPATDTIVGANNQNLTVESWVKYTTTATQRIITLGYLNAGATLLSLAINNTAIGNIGLVTTSAALVANQQLNHADSYHTKGTWLHVVGTTSSTNDRALYVNGVLKASDTGIGVASSSNLRQARIGANLILTQLFSGNVAISRVYSKTLSATEVLRNYNALKSRFGL